MTAVAELGPDTSAELVFAVVATAEPVVGPAGRPRAVLAAASRLAPQGSAGRLAARQEARPAPAAVSAAPSPVRAGTTPLRRLRPAPAALSPAPSPVRAGTGSLPRVRLVPALPVARPRTVVTTPAGPPPTPAERIQVLRADDRSLVLEQSDDERGAPATADPALLARRLASASIEVIAGSRPAAQMARWLAPGVLDALRSRAVLSRHAALRLTHAPTVRNLRICPLDERVVEASAVVDDGRRVRAVAVRLEAHRGAWRATALEVG